MTSPGTTLSLGQLVSVSGTWMQSVALGWLVYGISDDSEVAVGIITALQHVVVLGLATVVDLPTRQAFINELVEPADIVNAVGLKGS